MLSVTNSETNRPLGVKETSDAVTQFGKQHRVQGWAQLQAQEIFNIGTDVQTHFLMSAHHEGQQPLQEPAEGCLTVHFTRAHRDHGALALAHWPHWWTVGTKAGSTALLQTHSTQSTQEACHVDPLLINTRNLVLEIIELLGTKYELLHHSPVHLQLCSLDGLEFVWLLVPI